MPNCPNDLKLKIVDIWSEQLNMSFSSLRIIVRENCSLDWKQTSRSQRRHQMLISSTSMVRQISEMLNWEEARQDAKDKTWNWNNAPFWGFIKHFVTGLFVQNVFLFSDIGSKDKFFKQNNDFLNKENDRFSLRDSLLEGSTFF